MHLATSEDRQRAADKWRYLLIPVAVAMPADILAAACLTACGPGVKMMHRPACPVSSILNNDMTDDTRMKKSL